MKRLLISAVILLLLGSCNSFNKIVLTENGESSYEIIVAENADSILLHSANELSYYLEKISGVHIPVTTIGESTPESDKIFVGESDQSEDLKPHSVCVRTNGANLYIEGGTSKSTLYAVYDLLERELGCLWLSPVAEFIPKNEKITINSADYSYTPKIETRTVHSKLFYENHVFADKLKVTYEAFPGYVPAARVHTFHRFMPEEKFYKDHPDYYALRGDKRLTTQLCLTNPDVLRIVIDSVRSYFDQNPDARIISVSQDDNTLHCQCESCAAIDSEEGSASGTMIRFVNSVAEQFPDKTISTLAYQYTRKPCLTRPVDNVLITLCSIECDRSKPIEEGCADFTADLKGWKLLTENIRIWDYTTQFTNFLAPFPNIRTIRPNILLFSDNNARWVFEQHSHNPSELFELRSYLTAKLLWNPSRESDEIIEEFVSGYYKEAGSFVKQYIDLVHNELEKTPSFFLFLYGDPSQAFDSFLRPEMLDKYNDLYDMAGQAVIDKPIILERVNSARLSVEYASLEASRKGVSESYNLSEKNNILQRLNTFEQTCKNSGILLMNEMGFTVDEYVSLFRQTVERAKLPNLASGKNVELLTIPKKYAGEDPLALTDGALGGNSFYSNWLGFEGNDLEAVLDLGELKEISSINTAFLQVTNHIVFFPEKVSYYYSEDNKNFEKLDIVYSSNPLGPGSKVNDIEYFNINFPPVNARYIKIHGQNIKQAPEWHNASGLPAWIFCDEVIVY